MGEYTTIRRSTVNGYAKRSEAGGESWGSIVAGNGTYSKGGMIYILMRPKSIEDSTWSHNSRGIMVFDTTPLFARHSIVASKLFFSVESRYDTMRLADQPTPPTYNVYSANTLSDGSINDSDYESCGGVPFSTARPWAADSPTFELNANGLAHITGTRTGFSLKFNYDPALEPVPNPLPTTEHLLTQLAIQNRPLMRITYSDGGTPPPTSTSTSTSTDAPTGKWTGIEWDSLSKIRGVTIGAGDLECGVDLS